MTASDGRAARVVAVVQARMQSTRLPGKVLRDLGGEPVLAWVLRAARAAEGVDEVVVATSTEAADDAVAAFAEEHGTRAVRGSQDDVLGRFLLAAGESGADAVVRLTADCPLLDPAVISQAVALWRLDPTLDYVSTTQDRSLPRGLDVEVAAVSALRAADARREPHHRAHVTSALYEEGSGFGLASLSFRPPSDRLRVTLDTEDDARLLDELAALLPARPPRWRDVVRILAGRPDIVALNAHVEQKPLLEG
ncbi:cytidylyltransferase domain-containing protein [Sinomonas susongensis]|uniref:cytidylyltransferase domain-containing protein n=1 Tax=Sinomonas susongensis TaxID=1324851 RepID=UPI001107D114|nr:NTP transferase domain-containing protein [Sinomonas susongensis]